MATPTAALVWACGVVLLASLSHGALVSWKDTQAFASTSGHTYQYSVATGPHGQIYGVGHTTGTLDLRPAKSSMDAFLRKTNSDGVHEWTRFWAGSSATTRLVSVTTDPGGNIYACGQTNNAIYASTGTAWSLLLVKLDPNGDLVFGRQYSDAGTIQPTSSVPTCPLSYSGGALFMSFWTGTSDAWRTVRLSASTGDVQWGVDLDPTHSLNVRREGQALTSLDADGSVLTAISFLGDFAPEESDTGVVSSFDGSTSDYSIVLTKYEPSGGGLLWRQFWLGAHTGGSGLYTYSVTSDSNGDVYVCGLISAGAALDGETGPHASYHSAFVVKASGVDGSKVWQRMHRFNSWSHQTFQSCQADWKTGYLWALATDDDSSQSQIILLDPASGDVVDQSNVRVGNREYPRSLILGQTGLLYEAGFFYHTLESLYSGTKFASRYHPYVRRFAVANETENCACDELESRLDALGPILGLNHTLLLNSAQF